MGYADGGGDNVNVWRSVSHMEAILQALTYPEIGSIVSTPPTSTRPGGPPNGVRFLVQSGVDFIVGYPDVGVALAEAVSEAEAGHPYLSFSAGYVGLPGQEGALTPGEDYTAVIGEDLSRSARASPTCSTPASAPARSPCSAVRRATH